MRHQSHHQHPRGPVTTAMSWLWWGFYRSIRQMICAIVIINYPNCVVLVTAAKGQEVIPTVTIEGHLQYSNRVPYNISTQIVVNHGEYVTYSRVSDGNFTIHDVPPGVYVIDIQSPIHHFSQVKCQYKPKNSSDHTHDDTAATVTATTSGSTSTSKPDFSCIEYYYPGAMKRTIDPSTLLVLTALASYEYFETKRGFSLLSIVKNPMILMMIVTVGIMYLLPKMMENMDPEERAMMQKQMEMQQNPTQMMSQLFTGGASSSSNTDPVVAMTPAATSSTTTTTTKQSKRNRK